MLYRVWCCVGWVLCRWVGDGAIKVGVVLHKEGGAVWEGWYCTRVVLSITGSDIITPSREQND